MRWTRRYLMHLESVRVTMPRSPLLPPLCALLFCQNKWVSCNCIPTLFPLLNYEIDICAFLCVAIHSGLLRLYYGSSCYSNPGLNINVFHYHASLYLTFSIHSFLTTANLSCDAIRMFQDVIISPLSSLFPWVPYKSFFLCFIPNSLSSL